MTDYQLSPAIIKKYAHLLVNYALNSGKGIKPGEVVRCVVPDTAKSLALALQNTILKAKAHPLIRLIPTGFDKSFYTLANQDQLTFFPKKYLKAQADKENKGKYTWTAALWPTPAKAKEVGLTLKQYSQQIINACFLDKKDPIAKWKQITKLQQSILKKLNSLNINSLHIKGKDANLNIKLGSSRIWNGGSGRNIPSFEVFTSPDWQGTNGWIRFNQPLYRYGNILKNIYLQFNQGKVIKAKAEQGNKFLQQMLKTTNADKIGEFSLTDNRLSKITHFMAETLYDENIGGPYGNIHIALGMAYKDCYKGDSSKLSKTDWQKLSFNDSAEHTDIISTTNRTVTAVLKNGSKKTIYKNGRFTL